MHVISPDAACKPAFCSSPPGIFLTYNLEALCHHIFTGQLYADVCPCRFFSPLIWITLFFLVIERGQWITESAAGAWKWGNQKRVTWPLEILEAHISGDYYSTISLMEQRWCGRAGDTAQNTQHTERGSNENNVERNQDIQLLHLFSFWETVGSNHHCHHCFHDHCAAAHQTKPLSPCILSKVCVV